MLILQKKTGYGEDVYSPEVLADSPWLYWRMSDDGPPNVSVDDISGNARDGFISNLITTGVTGLPGCGSNKAFTFLPAQNSYVSQSLGFGTPASFTFEVWVKLVSLQGAFLAFVNQGSSNGSSVYIGMNDSNKWHFNIWTGSQHHSATSLADATVGGWNHIVGTKSVANGMRLYVNGSEAGTNAFTGNSDNRSLIVAGRILTTGNTLPTVNGSMDELAIYTTELSPTRVLAHYNASGV